MAHEVPAAGRLVGWLSNEGLPVGVVAAGGSKEEQAGNLMRTRQRRLPLPVVGALLGSPGGRLLSRLPTGVAGGRLRRVVG